MSTGLDAQIGFAEESTYGTPVTVTRFLELLNESVKTDRPRRESQGLRAGARVQRSSRWVAGPQAAQGDIEFEIANKGFGLLLKHMFGAAAAPAIPGGGTLTRDHVFTPGALDLLSLTMQKGVPPVTPGTAAQAFTYHGTKVAEWEVECAIDDIPKLTLGVLCEEEETSIALAAASYASDLKAFPAVDVTLTVDGSPVDVASISLKGNNGLKDDRYSIGSTKRRNPLEIGLREYSGEFAGEFVDLIAYNRFVNGNEVALVLAMQGDVIEGALRFGLTFTCNVRFDGETPVVGGPDIVEQPMSFKCINTGAGDDTAITVLYRTTDLTL